jgi:hypothetical protein
MKLVAACILLSSTIAVAEEPPVPPVVQPQPQPQPLPPQPRPMPPTPTVERGGPPARGFQIQGRMSTTIGIGSLINPGFSMGYRRGNWVFGGQLGVIAGKLEDNGDTDQFSLVTIMPMVYYGIWSSEDRRARMDVVGGIGVGGGQIKSESGGVTSKQNASFVPFLLGLGGDYYLHKNFALGVEIAIELPVLGKIEDNGMDTGVKGSTQSIHGMLRFTFVTGD